MHGAHIITATPAASLGFQTIIETFQMRYCITSVLSQGASKLPEAKGLDLCGNLIKGDGFGAFNFDFWQF